MPLKNHAKLHSINQWNSFHSMWCSELTRRLNLGHLPVRFEAKPSLHVGTNAEIDVATVEERENLFAGMNGFHPGGDDGGGGVAVAAEPKVYTAPAPTLTADNVTFTDTDLFEVQVFSDGGWKLVAAIGLVSPANKDRDDTVHTFTVKAASYLQAGVSLVVVDVVAGRSAELHDELCDLLDLPAARWGSPTGFSVVSYRTRQDPKRATPTTRYGKVALDVWPYAVGYGDELPTVPLWLTPSLAVPLELEPTYTSTCAGLRIH